MSDTQHNSTPEIRLPIRVPKFTFIVGGDRVQNMELCDALVEQDDSALEASSMLDCLFEAASIFRTGEFTPLRDARKDISDKILECFRNAVSSTSVAQAMIRRAEDSIDIVCERIVYFDAELDHIQPFLDKFGADNCVLLMAGPLRGCAINVKVVWLPSPSTEERLALIRRVLGEIEE